MLRRIKVVPLAAESLGVRSLCTYVETPDVRVLLDAGVSIPPRRFRLPPHPLEFEAIRKSRQKIAEFAEKANVVTISHYHFDHHTPSYEDWLSNWTNKETAQQIYEGKLVLAKNYRENINASQRRRGWTFEKTGGKHAENLEFVDGKAFAFGETKMNFSHSVPHGVPNSPLGWLVMTTIEHEDEKMMFASDVQGPLDNATLSIIQAEKPQLLVVGGPPLYLVGFRVSEERIQRSLKNLEALSKMVPVTIVDHHLLRDQDWREPMKHVFQSAKAANNEVVTAAAFLGQEEQLLEAKRKQLFEKHPPSSDFKRWSKLPDLKQSKTKPPLAHAN